MMSSFYLNTNTSKIIAAAIMFSIATVLNNGTIKITAWFLINIFWFLPFLFLVQTAVCSANPDDITAAVFDCVFARSVPFFSNVLVLSGSLLFVISAQWNTDILTTINASPLPHLAKVTIIISANLVGEFRLSALRVHQAFTARGVAAPAPRLKNVFALPSMLGCVWAATLNGIVGRMREQWASRLFWDCYIPVGHPSVAAWKISDYFAVTVALGLVAFRAIGSV